MVYLTDMDDSGSSVSRMLYIPIYAWKLYKYSKKHNIQLIQSHVFRANYVNALSRKFGATHKVQVVNHSIASRYLEQGILGKFNLALMNYFYHNADTIVTISKKMQQDLNNLFNLPNKKVTIYNPHEIKTIIALSEEPTTKFKFNPRIKYLITIGRLVSLKQFEDVISALAKVPTSVQLIMIGADGGELEKLKKLAKKLKVNNRIHFLGHVTNPYKYIKRSDIFISSSRTEGFPNVHIEAMLCNTAVISSDCTSGPREILAPDTDFNIQIKKNLEQTNYGVLYPVGQVNQLEEAIKLLLENNELREKIRSAAFIRANQFSVTKVVHEYKNILFDKEPDF
jgi:N-acetylgalactosamine-N,N'-diacetylbacillosaminyl-diphospho-undecaprenol 4-alpha-N-acetylgalactosaminyltransferase